MINFKSDFFKYRRSTVWKLIFQIKEQRYSETIKVLIILLDFYPIVCMTTLKYQFLYQYQCSVLITYFTV